MENTKMNFKGHDSHKRFFDWLKEKMTGEDAFDIMYGEKGKDYPAEMKKEFTELFNRKKEFHEKLHKEKKAFMNKWKEYAPEGHDWSDEDHYGGCCHGGSHGMGHGGW